MLPEFIHFIFTTIDTHLLLWTQHLSQNTQIFIKINTDSVVRPKCFLARLNEHECNDALEFDRT